MKKNEVFWFVVALTYSLIFVSGTRYIFNVMPFYVIIFWLFFSLIMGIVLHRSYIAKDKKSMIIEDVYTKDGEPVEYAGGPGVGVTPINTFSRPRIIYGKEVAIRIKLAVILGLISYWIIYFIIKTQ